MSGYLEIPSYYINLTKDNFSKTLQCALNKEDLLIYLREVYQTNISLFYDIRDELLLRGIVFKKEYQNNLFPNLPYEIQLIIDTERDEKKYKDIDTNITGIKTIINRFKVDTDLFFRHIPVEGIAYYLNNDANLLSKQFESVGFSIRKVRGNNITDSEGIIKNESNDMKTGVIQDIVNILSPALEQGNITNLIVEGEGIKIQEYFDGREYLAFHRYCNVHRKVFLSELTVDFIKGFQHVKGVGIRKYLTVLNRFDELSNENRPVVIKNPALEEKKVTAVEFFANNSLKVILEQKNIDYLTFIDSIYFVKEESDLYNPVPQQLFEEKSSYLQTLVSELDEEKKANEFKTLQYGIKAHPHYEFLMDLKIINIQHILQIPTSLGKKDDDIRLFEMIEDSVYRNDLKKIEEYLRNFKPPYMELEFIEKLLTDREWQVVIGRLDKTLQEVGDIIGITRERVRQIERRALQKLEKKAKYLNLAIYFDEFLQKKPSMSINEFMKKLQIDGCYKDIFLLIVDCEGSFERKDEVLVNKYLYNNAKSVQNKIVEQGKMIIEATEVIEQFNESCKFEFSLESIDYCMSEIKYQRKNGLYFKETIKLPAKISYIFKNIIDGPFEITDENFDYLQLLMAEVFDERFESGKRPAIERIRDTKNVILVEGNTFMYQELDNISKELLTDIEQAIDEELNKTPMITATILYQNHLEKWKMYGLLSQYHLYSLVQYHFNDEYLIGKGNTLGIFRSEGAKVNTESILVNYLEKHAGVSSKKKILDDLNWKPYKLEQLLSRSRKMISVEEEGIEGISIKLISFFELNEDDLSKIQKFLKKNITDDYFFTTDILIEMEFEDELSEILARAKITTPYTFGSILKWINPDLRGYQQLLYKKNSEIDSIEKVIIQTFPNLVRRDEIESFLGEKGYALSSVFSVINLLLKNESFYAYTGYQFINATCVNFTYEVKDSLSQYLKKSFGNKLYLSALELTGYTSDILPISSYGWQPQLIAEFASRVGYIPIKTTSDYRYNKWILIREELGITNYEELIHFVVVNEYEGNFHERDLAQFLEERKLTHSPHQLNLELKTSKYFEAKELGFIKLKENPYGLR